MEVSYKRWIGCFCVALGLLFIMEAAPAPADEVFLKNEDRISGKVISQDTREVVVDNDFLGSVTIPRAAVREVVIEQERVAEEVPAVEEKPAVEWTRDFSLGYTVTEGNTETSSFSVEALIRRKTEDDEVTLKGRDYVASSEGDANTQQIEGSARYAHVMGKEKKWFNFYQVSAEHDRFKNVQARLLPQAGVGYAFADTDEWMAKAEAGLGWSRTEFRDDTEERSELVATPRIEVKKAIWKDTKLNGELALFPSLTEFENFRVRSEVGLRSALNERVSIKLQLINEYQNQPAEDAHSSDLQFISSLVLSV